MYYIKAMPKSPKKHSIRPLRTRPTRRTSKKQFSTNIERDTLKNGWWRKVISTTKNMQITLMSVPPKEELGWGNTFRH